MPRRVILDTDTGVDDALAILLALRSPELRVEAITGVGGNTPLRHCMRNILITLEVLGLKTLPEVASGEAHPLVRKLHFAGDIHGSDGLGEATLLLNPDGSRTYPDSLYTISPIHAVDLILHHTSQYKKDLTLIAVGPLTNIAKAIIKNPQNMCQIREIIIMGGAFETGGNVSNVAEFNIHADPEAAQIVCDSGIPLLFVPLDVTRQALLDAEIIQKYASQGGAQAKFVYHSTSKYVDFHRQGKGINGCFLHDPLAVAVAIQEVLVTLVPARVDVETTRNFTTGMTVSNLRCYPGANKNARVSIGLDVHKFLNLFTERVLA